MKAISMRWPGQPGHDHLMGAERAPALTPHPALTLVAVSTAYIEKELRRWTPIVKVMGIKIE
jgi:hypothetical protein